MGREREEMNNQLLSQSDAEKFIRLWQQHTGAFVAREFSITRQRAFQLADQLIAAGVPLKNRVAHNSLAKNLDIEELINIANKWRK